MGSNPANYAARIPREDRKEAKDLRGRH